MLPWRVMLTIIAIYVPLNLFIIILTWWPPSTQPAIPSYVTPGVATGIIAGGFIYWIIFAKLMPWLGFHIDSQPDELVDGSRIVTYKVLPAPPFFLLRACQKADTATTAI